MQAKDVPTIEVLGIVAEYNDGKHPSYNVFLRRVITERWCLMRDLQERMPEVPFKVLRAKMGKLIRQDLVDGCDCGCRGDFEITPKGRALLAA